MSIIQPILAVPRHQSLKAKILAEHCRKLDGTQVRIFDITPEMDAKMAKDCPFPDNAMACLQTKGFLHGAEQMKGDPFIWLEVDSIPLKPGWAKALTAEFNRQGKDILISGDCQPPVDLVGGIGVYSGNMRWLVPKNMPVRNSEFGRGRAFDLWMLEHLQPLVATTFLIQHSYGRYGNPPSMFDHRFPAGRISPVLRPEAVIFHRDPNQDLILNQKHETAQRRFYHSGDLGDIVAALAVIRNLGGGELVIGRHMSDDISKGGPREEMTPDRAAFVMPLVKTQPYVKGASFGTRTDITHDFSTFRTGTKYSPGDNLCTWQSRHLKLDCGPADLSPWLTVTPASETVGRVIVARSPRYHNPRFPWPRVMSKFKSAVLFLGTQDEHAAFEKAFGKVEHRKVGDALEMARLIAGSFRFYGNQSMPCWIAMGLGHPMTQETDPNAVNANSIIERDNTEFFQ